MKTNALTADQSRLSKQRSSMCAEFFAWNTLHRHRVDHRDSNESTPEIQYEDREVLAGYWRER